MNNGLSLKSLAEDLLNVSLDKSLELRCSDWEADQLTLKQVAIYSITVHICFREYTPPAPSPHQPISPSSNRFPLT